ncbi:CopL family metal-binding regulatory protein [Pseudoxanthomonas composti]|uniref:CopL family metal-binding regulatory protein n=1 Tax=Pseudoxanthomonas composti TaxID=2137479 RepID=A0A4Q1JYY6_9GAMM|nr:CopL family metal-binding regulatory protein [Pseudoxanthomonas composti]RXR07433.1 hypothetical protein EPA99_05835 [Pseudoxanthomonas composti]
MSLASFLLRILLSVLLVFNGAAGAAAGVRMAAMEHGAKVMSSPAPQPGMAACHDKAAGTKAAHASADHADADHSRDDTCCKDRDACRCDCLHQASALMPGLRWLTVSPPPPSAVVATVHRLAAAPQRLPLRPPIA